MTNYLGMENDRIRLVSCGPEILRAAVAGAAELQAVLGVELADDWTEFGARIFRYSLAKLAEAPESQAWWTYFIIHKANQMLIGTGGYKGPPLEGTVDIGYEIAPAYRNRGLATEAAKLLTQHALQKKEVQRVQAHTLVGPNGSTRVLEKAGFKFIKALDSLDGQIWEWQYQK